MIFHTRYFLKNGARALARVAATAAALACAALVAHPGEAFSQTPAAQNVVNIRALQPFASEARLAPARMVVTRAGDVSQPLDVHYTLGGSATNGVDYQPLSGTLSFAAGQSAANLFIQPKQDALPEGAETVLVRIAASGAYTVGRLFLAGARIVDNDMAAARGITLLPQMPRFFFPASSVSEHIAQRFYAFRVNTATALNVTVTGAAVGNLLRDLTANVGLELLDSNGAVLARSDRSGQSAEFLRKIAVTPGVYFLRVFYVGSGKVSDGNGGTTTVNATAFQLALSAGPDWDIVSGNGEAHHVGLLAIRADGRRAPVASGARTWLVTHGRASSPASFVPLGRTMDASEPGDQILLLDWRTAAAPHSIIDLTEGRWFAPIASRIAPMLNARNLTRGNLNLLGHSWGTYISYEIGSAIGGGDASSRFVALDAALTADNYNVNDADFSAVSLYSWAFWASPFGSEDVALTADDSFEVSIPSPNPIAQHTGVVELFDSMLRSGSPVAGLFRLNRINASSRIWQSNPSWYDRRLTAFGNMPFLQRATDGFEGKLYAAPDGRGGWNAAAFAFDAK